MSLNEGAEEYVHKLCTEFQGGSFPLVKATMAQGRDMSERKSYLKYGNRFNKKAEILCL